MGASLTTYTTPLCFIGNQISLCFSRLKDEAGIASAKHLKDVFFCCGCLLFNALELRRLVDVIDYVHSINSSLRTF